MAPHISVVMPTRDRGKLLPRALQALSAQTVSPDEFELIIVADGCRDDTPDVVASSNMPYRITYIEQPGLGAATARNKGVEAASAPILLFLDDDMEAQAELISRHLEAHQRRPGGVVLGYFPIPPEAVRTDPFAIRSRDWWDEGFRLRSQPGYQFTFRDFCTGNISMPANLFRSLGGFCQTISGAAAGEDIELGYRLLQQGVPFQFAREAISIHHDCATFERALHRVWSEGLGDALIVQRHPELFWSLKVHNATRLSHKFPSLWRWLWRHPSLGDAGASLLESFVRFARRLRLSSAMWKIFIVLSGWVYLRGAMQGFGSLAVLECLEQDARLLLVHARDSK